MLVSLRQPIEVPAGHAGNVFLMALAARPPRRGNDKRPSLAFAAIRHYAAWGFYDQFGYDHPLNPRTGNRGRASRRASLEGVFSDLGQSLAAGRLFLSSLYAAVDPRAAKAGAGDIRFRGTDFSLNIPVAPHSQRIAALVEQMASAKAMENIEPKNVRQARWDNWLPTIHLSAAYVLMHDSNDLIQGVAWREFCRAMLFVEGNDHLPATLVSNANMLLKVADECHFFPRARPRPFLLKD